MHKAALKIQVPLKIMFIWTSRRRTRCWNSFSGGIWSAMVSIIWKNNKHIKFNLPCNYTETLLKLFESAFSHTSEEHIYINLNNFSLPEQHSVWDCRCLCRHRRHPPRPLGPAHQVGELQSARGKWPAGWGSAASASAPSTKKRKFKGFLKI